MHSHVSVFSIFKGRSIISLCNFPSSRGHNEQNNKRNIFPVKYPEMLKCLYFLALFQIFFQHSVQAADAGDDDADTGGDCIMLTITDKMDGGLNTKFWQLETGEMDQLDYSKGYLQMHVNKSSPVLVISSKAWFTYPVTLEFALKPSPISGIISPMIMKGPGEKSDEIDVEFTGLQPQYLQTVLWKKGKRVNSDIKKENYDPQDGFHKYSVTWTKDSAVYKVSFDGEDGLMETVREYKRKGDNWPLNAMPLKFGPWAKEDDEEWAGKLDWKKDKIAFNSIKDFKVAGCMAK